MRCMESVQNNVWLRCYDIVLNYYCCREGNGNSSVSVTNSHPWMSFLLLLFGLLWDALGGGQLCARDLMGSESSPGGGEL